MGRVSMIPRTKNATDGQRPRAQVPGRGALLIAAAAVTVGALLPWVEAQVGTFWGLQGAGRLSFYAGIIGLAGAMHRRPVAVALHAAVVAGAGLGFGAWQLTRMVSMCPPGGCGPGLGLILTSFGGALAVRAVWLASRSTHRS